MHILGVVRNLWGRDPMESNTLLHMLHVISLNMAITRNSTKPVDLWALKCKLSFIREVPFDFDIQQDALHKK